MPMSRDQLILFTRYPVPGRTKTRLIPALGAAGAAALQKRLTETVLARLLAFADQHPLQLEVCYDQADQARMRAWLSGPHSFRPQGEGDLGVRLHRAFSRAFQEGKSRVVVVGADCPALTPSLLAAAFALLRDHDLVAGPAADGGYYLLGLTRPQPFLFQAIAWGTDTVLAATLARAYRQGLCWQLLPVLADVDRPEDLRHLNHYPHPE